jgi:hypothetical protein
VEEWTSRYPAVSSGVIVQAQQVPASVRTCRERAIADGREDLVAVIERMAAACDLSPNRPILPDEGDTRTLADIGRTLLGEPPPIELPPNPAERVVRALEDWLDACANAALGGPSLKPDVRRQLLVDALTYLATGE